MTFSVLEWNELSREQKELLLQRMPDKLLWQFRLDHGIEPKTKPEDAKIFFKAYCVLEENKPISAVIATAAREDASGFKAKTFNIHPMLIEREAEREGFFAFLKNHSLEHRTPLDELLFRAVNWVGEFGCTIFVIQHHYDKLAVERLSHFKIIDDKGNIIANPPQELKIEKIPKIKRVVEEILPRRETLLPKPVKREPFWKRIFRFRKR